MNVEEFKFLAAAQTQPAAPPPPQTEHFTRPPEHFMSEFDLSSPRWAQDPRKHLRSTLGRPSCWHSKEARRLCQHYITVVPPLSIFDSGEDTAGDRFIR